MRANPSWHAERDHNRAVSGSNSEYETKGVPRVVGSVAYKDGWLRVKESLLKNVGMNAIPVIRVVANFGIAVYGDR